MHRHQPKPNQLDLPEPNGAENFEADGLDERILKFADSGPNQIPNRIVVRDMVPQHRLDTQKIKESVANQEKKGKLVKHLKELSFNQFRLKDDRTRRLILKFADELLEQHETRDEGTQTDDQGGFMQHDVLEIIAKSTAGLLDAVLTL